MKLSVKRLRMLESSLQKFFHHEGEVSQFVTQVWTTSAKPKLFALIRTMTRRTRWVAAYCCSAVAWPTWPAPSS